MKLSEKQLFVAKALCNGLYYLANKEKWQTTYAENRRRRLARPKRRPWTREEEHTLRRLYPDHDTAWVAGQLNRTKESVYGWVRVMGLRKSPAFLAAQLSSLGVRVATSPGAIANRFQKGLVPANKGTRRPGWGPGRMKETQYRKGRRSGKAAAHHMPIGSTRLIDGYLYLKVADVSDVAYTVNWKPLHMLNWERANGRPLPDKHCLRFRDGNRMNGAVENMELISRGENMLRNTIHRYPKDLAGAIQLRGALMRKINKRVPRHEKQDNRPA